MTVSIQGRNVNYLTEGCGPKNVLLVHGWSGTINSLRPIHDLLKQTYTSTIIDLPGRGDSALPDPSWGCSEYATFLKDFMLARNIEHCLYVGHSFGGSLGICLAATYPHLIDQLVLCAPSYKRELGKSKQTASSIAIPTSLKPFIQPVRKLIYKLFYPSSDIFLVPQLEPNFRKIVTEDLTHLLPSIHQPTLIMWGDADTATPVAHSKLLHEQLSNSRLEIFKGYRHSFPLVVPEKVVANIKDFVATL